MIQLKLREGLKKTGAIVREHLKRHQSFLLLVGGKYDCGKYEVIKYLLRRYPDCLVIHHNDFAEKGMSLVGGGDPRSIKWQRLIPAATDSKNGITIHKPCYNPETRQSEGEEEVKPARLIIIWGAFALWNADLNRRADLRIYVEAERVCRFTRYFLSELPRLTPDQILNSLISGVQNDNPEIEPTKHLADFAIVNDATPEFEYLKARKLVDQCHWPIKLTSQHLSVFGRISTGPSNMRTTTFFFDRSDRQVIRVRKDTIAFLEGERHAKTDGTREVWYEFPISPEASAAFIGRFFDNEALMVSMVRTIYKLPHCSVLLYVDREVEITQKGKTRGIGDYSGILVEPGRKGRQAEIDGILDKLDLSLATKAIPYYQLT